MLATSAHPLNVERLRLLCQPPIARLAPPLHLSEALVLGNLREDVRLVLLALLVAAMGHTIPYWSVRAVAPQWPNPTGRAAGRALC